ncbi:hypothetical protein CDD82_7755 [Ophiocordyceps australis]|uniref:Ubiquitination network signaling protein n=1 Tax=Ophiocordyceps australis TaxID=1399860 RepID=A0A2C5YIU5_9HYPO|nr:hypothetical protein CDD82_7755 [Ophiocordyceps australis]
MPRASGSSKRQQGVGTGHRDSPRHDNGPLGHSKRPSARKSHSSLGGSARSPDHGAGHAGPSSCPSPAASSLHQAAPTKRSDDTLASALEPANAPRRSSLGTHSESSSESGFSFATHSLADTGHGHIDISAVKHSDIHNDSGPLDLAAAVVRSLPVQDTLAILIILTHIPYMLLTFVYVVFTAITFVPPVATRAGWNLNIGDIFDSNAHTPSLATVFCMDFFFFLVWVFLWPPLQDFVLEFAKPTIAVTVGGGATAKHGASKGATACLAWLSLCKLIRSSTKYWGRLERHLCDALHIPPAFRFSLADSLPTAAASHDRRSTHGWIQSLFAIHILTQGIIRYIREWYLRRERANATARATDPEIAKPPVHAAAAAPGNPAVPNTIDISQHNPILPVQASQSSPASSSSSSSPAAGLAKKRRKQSAQVRMNQPLWAALASTKITFMKEMELSEWSSPLLGPDRRDIHNSGEAILVERKPRQIWISYIGCDQVCFGTSPFPDPDDEAPCEHPPANGHVLRPAGVDTSKPFYVRINNAFWQPTRIFPINVESCEDDDDDDDDDNEGLRWTGDIYGLRPSSKYVCEFVDSLSDKVIFVTSIRTVPEPLQERESASPAVAPADEQAMSPDSPTTTLRTSIVAAEARLVDEKNRLKTLRKECKLRANTLKRENELADNQLQSAGNSDDKYRQKIRQQETQRLQADRDVERLSQLIDKSDASPQLSERRRQTERAYTADKKIFDAAQKELKDYKLQLENEVKAKEVEKSNLNTRRNKTATRIAKVENELANITDANNRGLDEEERRTQSRTAWLEYVSGIESNYVERLEQTRSVNCSKRDGLYALQGQLRAFHNYCNMTTNGIGVDGGGSAAAAAHLADTSHGAFQQQQQQQQQTSPWNAPPSSTPAPRYLSSPVWASLANDGRSSVMATVRPGAGMGGGGTWKAGSVGEGGGGGGGGGGRMPRTRGRSSSMLSDVSGFTQASDEACKSPATTMTTTRPPHRPLLALVERNGGSGSGGSADSGSLKDVASPT